VITVDERGFYEEVRKFVCPKINVHALPRELRENLDYLSDLHYNRTWRCDYRSCPTRKEPLCELGICDFKPETCGMYGSHAACFTGHHDECLLALKARSMVEKVRNGEIRIHQPNNEGWKIQVEQ